MKKEWIPIFGIFYIENYTKVNILNELLLSIYHAGIFSFLLIIIILLTF